MFFFLIISFCSKISLRRVYPAVDKIQRDKKKRKYPQKRIMDWKNREELKREIGGERKTFRDELGGEEKSVGGKIRIFDEINYLNHNLATFYEYFISDFCKNQA